LFNKEPICEICNHNQATFFSQHGEGGWKFTCETCENGERYFIVIRGFFKQPAATVDWLAHLNEKNWMDWTDFAEMMYRFRDATNSFFELQQEEREMGGIS